MSLYDEVKEMLEAGITFSWKDSRGGFRESKVNAESFMEPDIYGLEGNQFNGISFECLANYGGEDCGSEYYAVYKFTRGDESCTIRFDGHYQSHYGCDYEGMKEVSAKQKTVTVWE